MRKEQINLVWSWEKNMNYFEKWKQHDSEGDYDVREYWDCCRSIYIYI